MRIPRLVCALLAVWAFASSGYSLTGSPARTSWFRPNAHRGLEDENLLSEDAYLENEDDKDAWGFVGKEGRGELGYEKDPDPPWLRNLLSSDKARAIEKNLGVE